ncbi:hypothetical protein Syun_017612 [Stephania yunnanensis]|uniref:tRNA-splicing endonuclease subunit Sen54 N-terminal domain-containing protein n=1 Tax=Stephania yunnanensis TaxID=152371 RepID=A0AAP0P599_9MAGN
MDQEVVNLSGGELQRVALCLCIGKVEAEIVQIEADDVPVAISNEVSKTQISMLVIGASSGGSFTSEKERESEKIKLYSEKIGVREIDLGDHYFDVGLAGTNILILTLMEGNKRLEVIAILLDSPMIVSNDPNQSLTVFLIFFSFSLVNLGIMVITFKYPLLITRLPAFHAATRFQPPTISGRASIMPMIKVINEQFRNRSPLKDVSKAQWDAAVGMAKVIEKKGGMWTTIGIIRGSELYCSIEETLYLVERGALVLLDVNSMVLPLENIYGMVSNGKSECSWESFQAYKHLKSLGYILIRHRVPWTSKIDKSSANLTSIDATSENSDILEPEISVTKLLQNMQINDMKPAFDVYIYIFQTANLRSPPQATPSFVLFLV